MSIAMQFASEKRLIYSTRCRFANITKSRYKKRVGVSLDGCVETGVKFEVLKWKDELEIKFSASGKGCIGGKVAYDFVAANFGGTVYLNPIVLKFSGVIKTPKDSTFQFELLNLESNVEIFDKYTIISKNE